MVSHSKWERVEYDVGDGRRIAFKVKALTWEEGAEFVARVLKAKDEARWPKNGTRAERAEAAWRFVDALGAERIEQAIGMWVKDVEGLQDEDGPITTGARLAGVADVAMAIDLVGEIVVRAAREIRWRG